MRVMKQIIDGKLYDTDTAELILSLADGKRRFYRTKKGAFFQVYDGTMGVLSEEAMKKYMGVFAPDIYVKLFGEVEEG